MTKAAASGVEAVISQVVRPVNWPAIPATRICCLTRRRVRGGVCCVFHSRALRYCDVGITAPAKREARKLRPRLVENAFVVFQMEVFRIAPRTPNRRGMLCCARGRFDFERGGAAPDSAEPDISRLTHFVFADTAASVEATTCRAAQQGERSKESP
jgi:hypothetical protein